MRLLSLLIGALMMTHAPAYAQSGPQDDRPGWRLVIHGARSEQPALMAEAIRLGVEAGRKAFLAGRMPVLPYASASSPLEGVVR